MRKVVPAVAMTPAKKGCDVFRSIKRTYARLKNQPLLLS
jgi:hypothetical protein